MSDTDQPTENEIRDITDIADIADITNATDTDAGGAEPEVAEVEVAEPETEPVAEPEVGIAEPEVEVAETEPEVAEVEVAETDAPAEPEPEVAEVDAPAEPEPEVAEIEVAEVDAPADGADGEAEVITEDELIEQPAVVDNPFTRPGRWFVVHTQSGYEKKVKQNLEARIHSMNAEEAVYEVVIPMEDYVDFKNGKRVVNQRKMFPGYLLVRAELDDTAWFVIRNTPGVTGFVGQGAKPSPLPRRDVEAFLMPKGGEEQVATRAKPRLEFELGETVRVREGPFADFSGEVIEINEDQLKLKVLVNIFGRETPVELEFSKVAKL
jgi:transcriptional antiterminator NusG